MLTVTVAQMGLTTGNEQAFARMILKDPLNSPARSSLNSDAPGYSFEEICKFDLDVGDDPIENVAPLDGERLRFLDTPPELPSEYAFVAGMAWERLRQICISHNIQLTTPDSDVTYAISNRKLLRIIFTVKQD